jgi:hypothetical protein
MNISKTIPVALAAIAICATAVAEESKYQTSNVIDVTGAGKPYQGATYIVRTPDSIEGRITTQVENANTAYTLWLVMFNNPEFCATPQPDGSTGCSGADLETIEVGACVYAGGGEISAANGITRWVRTGRWRWRREYAGVVTMDFSVKADGIAESQFVLFGDQGPGACTTNLAPGNGFEAELHLVVDEHPEVMPGSSWIGDLTTTNPPGGGPATNHRVAVFIPCGPGAACPESVL